MISIQYFQGPTVNFPEGTQHIAPSSYSSPVTQSPTSPLAWGNKSAPVPAPQLTSDSFKTQVVKANFKAKDLGSIVDCESWKYMVKAGNSKTGI